ncbi:M48 family metallopeptidase [Aureimonas pseudogalii]|uniref:YgjP-like metallopeptidase domain-containing protein n=1 Tax=Aureimonas pseudogalii TaxID=1744844 RepID=A0A7W6EGU4_9HYPH|nr:SprT family zinc-dependent metalloprotease [Aureimonas pseudogalii]MBB3997739.1 hypothetical protein [Aureimonas pseudogalii]
MKSVLPTLLRRLVSPRPPAASRFPETIDLGGRSLPVVVRPHAAARRITMRLAPGGEAVRLTVPPRVSPTLVAAFLDRHAGWVRERLAGAPPLDLVAPGTLLPFRGGTLRCRHETGRRAARIEANGPGDHGLTVGGDPARFARRVRDALKREARGDLEAAVAGHAQAVGLAPRAIALKDTVSRWGSCTADRRLAFSWRIVMAPPFALDYLAAHEVAHFREMNHGPRFWALCRELCPDMDRGRAWLKSEGASLHRFRFD